jgi:predicted nucleic acid-binding protein
MAAKYLIDTSSYITFEQQHLIFKDSHPDSFRLSSVVLQELTVGADDIHLVKAYGIARKKLEQANLLLVPSGEDWFEVGKILYLIQNKDRSRYGRAPKRSKDEVQRIIRDALIARTAKRFGCAIITENTKDFEIIKPYCKVKIIKGSEFFS